MKKTISTLLLLALATIVSHAQTHMGDLTLNSQTAVDTFNFTTVTGNLTISGGSITNLDGLSELTNIGGNLIIQSNFSLTSLSGLDSLTDIGGSLFVQINISLMSLSGLESLTEIGGGVDLQINPSLTSLSGLEFLTEIGGNIDIQLNATLMSLSGLESLTNIGGNLTISDNVALMSLSGLEMLESIGGTLSITGNPALTNFCSISSLIGNDKQITMGEYTVSRNRINPTYGLLQEVTYCDGSTFFGDLTLDTQDSIDAFRYREIIGNLTIDDAANGNITNLDGLRGLTEVRGFLSVGNNASLPSLSGLDALTAIGGYLSIEFNTSLMSVSGLASLTDIGGYLSIFSNTSLSSLSGLEMLASIGGALTISENTALTDFCAISSLIGDDKQITSGEYFVTTNGYNPPHTFTQNESLCSLSAGIFVGDLTLDTQDSIDAFSYRGVTGNLTINDTDDGNIMNLDGLRGLTEIGGYLFIDSNHSLTSLSGLDSLTEIGGYLWIQNNNSLLSLSGFSSLTEIGGNLSIQNNNSLMSLSGLGSLTDIGGNLYVGFNNSLMSLNGLEDLTEIGGYLWIQFNNSLMSLSGLGSLTEIGGYLNIISNNSLKSLSGLEDLTEIGGFLQIQSNTSLAYLSGLEMLASIGGALTITGNIALTDFCAISSLIGDDKQITMGEYILNTNRYNPSYTFIQNESLCSNADGEIFIGNLTLDHQDSIDAFRYRGITGNLTIQGSSITNLDSLESLTEIGGYFGIFSNDSLTSLSGLESLTEIGGYLAIQSNDSLTSLSGLSSLTEIGGFLSIFSNATLTSLSGLDSLTEIGGELRIQINTSLMSLSGLEMLDSIGGALTLTGNTALTNFCVISSLIGDDNQITSTEYTVTTNGYNPSFEEIQRSHRCSTNPPVVVATLQNVTTRSTVPFATINVAPAFSAPNRDTLTYTATSSDTAIVTVAVTDSTLTLTEVSTGMATITVTAFDAFGLSVDTSFMVIITPNNPPVVENPLVAIESVSGTAFAPIDISATFSDPDGDALTYTVASSNTAIVTAALNNTTLTLTETGKGTATITVTATDAFGLPFDATFMVTITNTAPTVATALTDVAIESGTAFETIDLSATFSDPNGDTLTYTVASSDAATVTAALNNTILTLTETGKGTATITVTASDAFGLSVDTSFVVTITNTAPTVATALTDVVIKPGAGFAAIDLSATFSDENGDALSYTAMSDNETVVTVSVSGDTLTLTETGTGRATITVTASDGTAPVSSAFMVAITTNTAPVVATALTDVSIKSGTAFETIDLSATFSDPDGDTLTYTVASSNTAIVTAALSDTILTLTETGKGTATITVTATDAFGFFADTSFVVTITNTAPTVATALTDVSIKSGTAFETIDLSATFSDENGDALSYTAMSDNETVVTVSVSGDTLTLTEVGIGTATITITATDPGGLSVSDSVMITVEEGETTLGIAETDILAVYPNPSSGVFELSKRADAVRVYDMSGRLIYRGRKIEQLDLTNNPIGQYLVEVRVGKERGRYTVIKQ